MTKTYAAFAAAAIISLSFAAHALKSGTWRMGCAAGGLAWSTPSR